MFESTNFDQNNFGAAQRMAILTYHSLDASGSVVSTEPQDFAGQMSCLADANMRGICLSEAISYRRAHGAWPQRSVVLTFDDGFANFYDAAWPVLRNHHFTATVFVVSGHMGGRNDWAPPPAQLGLREILSWKQAAELAASGIEIGSHTRTHPNLGYCTETEAARELIDSRSEIEDHLGRQVVTFAYPFGKTSAFSLQLAAHQFKAACTTELRHANKDVEFHRLPRIDMYYLRAARNFQRFLKNRLGGYLAARRYGRVLRHSLLSQARLK